MLCRQCQTEIDDKALICFRCGTATTDPVHQPYHESPGSTRSLPPLLLALIFLVTVGFFAVQAFRGGETAPAVWIMLVAAGVLLVLRLRRR
jgi:hypothetical protein